MTSKHRKFKSDLIYLAVTTGKCSDDISGEMNPEPTCFKGQKGVKTHSLYNYKSSSVELDSGSLTGLMRSRVESLEGTFVQRFEPLQIGIL